MRSKKSTLQSRPEKPLVLQPSEAKPDSFKIIEKSIAAPRPPEAAEEKKSFEVLRPNLIFRTRPFKYQSSLFGDDYREQRTTIANLIGFPQHKSLPYPEDLRKGVVVGVLNSRVDEQHCALPSDRIDVKNVPDNAGGDQRAKCDTLAEGSESDHGTHVVGLIGALRRKNNDNLAWGINPYARILSREIDFAGLADGRKVPEIVAELKEMVTEHGPRVVNMSFGYFIVSGTADLLEQYIAGLRYAVLFVIAAGNNGIEKTHICDVRPGCFDLPNVISIAGLNRDLDNPLLLQNGDKTVSNYGKRIHIGAIGEKVVSTLGNGGFGTLSGTSQAAPQVTAVASLLFSKYPELKPIEVKNRLIYCSDHVGKLDGKLFGGRLNAECTLDGDLAVSN